MEPFIRILLCWYSYLAGRAAEPEVKLYLKTIVLLMSLAISTIVVTGCAQMYHGFQAQSVDACYHLPYSEQQECLERVKSTYEAYEQERKKRIK